MLNNRWYFEELTTGKVAGAADGIFLPPIAICSGPSNAFCLFDSAQPVSSGINHVSRAINRKCLIY